MLTNTKAPLLLVAGLLAITPLSVGQTEAGKPEFAQAETFNQTLQENSLYFPLVEVQTEESGEQKFQTLEMNKTPLIREGERYDCFRFAAKHNGESLINKTRQSLVWAWVKPANMDSWYIVPERGEMNGFKDFFWVTKKRLPMFAPLLPESINRVHLQSLAGREFTESKEYLIWFHFKNSDPTRVSLGLRFSRLQANSIDGICAALQGQPSK